MSFFKSMETLICQSNQIKEPNFIKKKKKKKKATKPVKTNIVNISIKFQSPRVYGFQGDDF